MVKIFLVKKFLKNLKRENIDTSFVKITNNISTGIASIFIMPDGENSVNAVYGANYEIDKSQINDFEKILIMQVFYYYNKKYLTQ